MDDVSASTLPDLAKPPAGKKLISSASWGMLAGFWVELPLLLASTLKTPPRSDWLHAWSLRLVLPSTLVGVVYGWMRPLAAEKKHTALWEAAHRPASEFPPLPLSAWANAERKRGMAPGSRAR